MLISQRNRIKYGNSRGGRDLTYERNLHNSNAVIGDWQQPSMLYRYDRCCCIHVTLWLTVATPHLQFERWLLFDSGRPLLRREFTPGRWRSLAQRFRLRQLGFDAGYGLPDGFECARISLTVSLGAHCGFSVSSAMAVRAAVLQFIVTSFAPHFHRFDCVLQCIDFS
jgi:hypothetical protein